MGKRRKKLKKDMTRREKDKKQTAEVFTPRFMVSNILNRLPADVWEEREDNTFIDPACGDGNFLVSVFMRKLDLGHNPTTALRTVFGIDIIEENVRLCRLRLLKAIEVYGEKVTEEHVKIVLTNIRKTPLSRFSKGTISYVEEFGNSPHFFRPNFNKYGLKRWCDIIEEGALDKIELPVECNDEAEARIDIFEKEKSFLESP